MVSDFAALLRDAAQAVECEPVSSVFAEEPVSLRVFVEDKKFLHNPPLSSVQYEAVRHIERIYYNGWFRNEAGQWIYLPERDTYKQLASEFASTAKPGSLHVGPASAWREENYWATPTRMINFATLQWGKGCKTASMPVYDARTGEWIPISEWVGGQVAGADEDGRIETYRASAAWVSGRGECYRVTTASGLVDEVYAGHRYLVRGKIDQRDGRTVRKYYTTWQQLRAITVGDYIAAANIVPEPIDCAPLDHNEVELLGLLIGDGCHPHSGKKRFSVSLTVGLADTVVSARYIEIVEALGAKVVRQENDHRAQLFAVGTGGRGGNPIINLLRRYGMDGQEAHTKRVPAAIFRLPNSQITLFLARLIDTDGHIYLPPGGAVPEVGYTTASWDLAVGVQRLLLRLGCRAQIQTKRVKYAGETRVYYAVRMRDRTNVRTFCRQITTLSKEEARLRALVACDGGNGKTRARQGDLAWDKIVSIEPIGVQDYWDMEVPGAQNYVSNGTLNHNSGKDHVCRLASMRIAYLLMCLDSPQQYYAMPEQDTIHLLNVASSSAQAQQAFFMPIVRAVKRGWFLDRCEPKLNVISYAKNIESISGHSDAESQEGLNLMLGIADEIDAFKSKKEMTFRRGQSAREPTKSAESIINMMRTSGSTRYPEVFKQVRISFPRYLGSTIQRLTTEARRDIETKGIDSRHYVSGPLATWEVNPRVKGKEAFADDYAEDPILARSKYECRPARAVNPYFRNHQAVDACFKQVQQLPVDVGYQLENSRGRTVWVPQYTFSRDFYPVRGAAYAMHADMATTGDRAGIAMAHVAQYTEHEIIAEDEDGALRPVIESRPHVKVDFALAFTADSSVNPPREIQIRWARQLCFELIRQGFNIRQLTFDGFQCLHGDTKIPLLDGTEVPIRELAGRRLFWVYSIRGGHVVPGLCTKAWRTGFREDMVEVELDNAEKIQATSDHPFMLRDGTYRAAADLRPGDSLMPLYRRHRRMSPSSGLYEQLWQPEPDGSGQRWQFTHSVVARNTHGEPLDGYVVHHANLNQFDNSPENLVALSNAEHSALHRRFGENTFGRLWADSAWAANQRRVISETQTRVQTGKTGCDSRRYRQDLTFDLIERIHAQCICEGVAPTRAEMQSRLGCDQSALYRRVREAGFRSWKAYRDSREGVSSSNLYQRSWRRSRAGANHKVVAVRPAPGADVYDLQIEDHHNFAVGAGVFVHNSTDSMQILAARGIDSGRVSTDISEDPWRNLRDLAYEGRVNLVRLAGTDPAHPPTCLLRDELLGLTRLPNGRVDHASDGSKDIADAVACAVLGALQIGGAEENDGERAYYGGSDITVGRTFDLPLGATIRHVWERDVPAVF